MRTVYLGVIRLSGSHHLRQLDLFWRVWTSLLVTTEQVNIWPSLNSGVNSVGFSTVFMLGGMWTCKLWLQVLLFCTAKERLSEHILLKMIPNLFALHHLATKRLQEDSKNKNNCPASWERNSLSFWNIKFVSVHPLTNMRTSEMWWETKLDDVFVNRWWPGACYVCGNVGEENSVWTADEMDFSTASVGVSGTWIVFISIYWLWLTTAVRKRIR